MGNFNLPTGLHHATHAPRHPLETLSPGHMGRIGRKALLTYLVHDSEAPMSQLMEVLGSQNTGVFVNSPADSNDHLVNASGAQLAFLGSEAGNGLSQELSSVYQAGASYRLLVGVGVSSRFPPAMGAEADSLELAFYYLDGAEPVDIVTSAIAATGLSSTELQAFSLALPAVAVDAAWAGQAIGVAIRATGQAGGFWDLDDVRVLGSVGR